MKSSTLICACFALTAVIGKRIRAPSHISPDGLPEEKRGAVNRTASELEYRPWTPLDGFMNKKTLTAEGTRRFVAIDPIAPLSDVSSGRR